MGHNMGFIGIVTWVMVSTKMDIIYFYKPVYDEKKSRLII